MFPALISWKSMFVYNFFFLDCYMYFILTSVGMFSHGHLNLSAHCWTVWISGTAEILKLLLFYFFLIAFCMTLLEPRGLCDYNSPEAWSLSRILPRFWLPTFFHLAVDFTLLEYPFKQNRWNILKLFHIV